MTNRFLKTTTALSALLAAPLSALAHAGTDDGGHHGFLVDWLMSISDAQYLTILTTLAAAGLSWALAAAVLRQQQRQQQRKRRAAAVAGARR